MLTAAANDDETGGITLSTQEAGEQPFTDTRRFKVMRAIMGAANPAIRTLLQRGAGRGLNRALMLLRFRGRTSGVWYTTPVGFVRQDETVVVVTSRSYRWWKNIGQGAEVEVRVDGQWHEAHARVVPPDEAAFDELVSLQVSRRGPGMLRGFGVPVDDEGRVPEEARAIADEQAVIVAFRLGRALPGPSR